MMWRSGIAIFSFFALKVTTESSQRTRLWSLAMCGNYTTQTESRLVWRCTIRQGKIGLHEVVYASPLPGSTELTIKKAYVARVGDQICGVSAYLLKDSSNPSH